MARTLINVEYITYIVEGESRPPTQASLGSGSETPVDPTSK